MLVLQPCFLCFFGHDWNVSAAPSIKNWSTESWCLMSGHIYNLIFWSDSDPDLKLCQFDTILFRQSTYSYLCLDNISILRTYFIIFIFIFIFICISQSEESQNKSILLLSVPKPGYYDSTGIETFDTIPNLLPTGEQSFEVAQLPAT